MDSPGFTGRSLNPLKANTLCPNRSHSLRRYFYSHRRNSLLGNFIIHCSNIVSIQLHCPSGYLTPICSLEELFPQDTAIEKLVIEGRFPYLSGVIGPPTFPDLKKLRELTISSLYNPTDPVEPFDLLWHALKNCGAHLRKISMEYHISQALIEYLASPNDLQELGLNVRNRTIEAAHSSGLSVIPILDRHVSSLAPLHLQTLRYEEGMTIDPAIWPAPVLFSCLTFLGINAPEIWELGAGTVQSFIDYVAESPTPVQVVVRWTEIPEGLLNNEG
ncbi:hypothetical protein AX16_005774 [Volvariella volvacea WC 439]|nr:hypothetical protein AX16_005774 [Volvariella volvacea WC 439]